MAKPVTLPQKHDRDNFSPYKQVDIHITALFRNPNSSDVYNPTDEELENDLCYLVANNGLETLQQRHEDGKKIGFFHKDVYPAESIHAEVSVKRLEKSEDYRKLKGRWARAMAILLGKG